MLHELTGIVVSIVPYLFPIADFLIWLLTGNAFAIAGVFGNIINILLNYFLRVLMARMFPCSNWIFSPEIEEKPRCYIEPPNFLTKRGLQVEMPSLHAQQVAYYSIYWLLVLANSLDTSTTAIRKIFSIVLLEAFSFLVCFIRYDLEYSSLSQLVIGYIIGALWGVGYYYFINFLSHL